MVQIDYIDNRFFHQRLKVQKVICTERVQEFGDVTIPAPVGVTLDPLTGQLSANVTLTPVGIPQIRTVTVLLDKVINQGIVTASLSVNNVVVIPSIEIPFQGIIDCPGAKPGDLVQKHDVQIEGFSVSPVQLLVGGLPVLNLVLKVVIDLCVVVTEETIMKINAAEPFCK